MRVSTDGADPMDLQDWFNLNEFDEAERAEIEAQLAIHGKFTGGGGAMPAFVVTVEREEKQPMTEAEIQAAYLSHMRLTFQAIKYACMEPPNAALLDTIRHMAGRGLEEPASVMQDRIMFRAKLVGGNANGR